MAISHSGTPATLTQTAHCSISDSSDRKTVETVGKVLTEVQEVIIGTVVTVVPSDSFDGRDNSEGCDCNESSDRIDNSNSCDFDNSDGYLTLWHSSYIIPLCKLSKTKKKNIFLSGIYLTPINILAPIYLNWNFFFIYLVLDSKIYLTQYKNPLKVFK